MNLRDIIPGLNTHTVTAIKAVDRGVSLSDAAVGQGITLDDLADGYRAMTRGLMDLHLKAENEARRLRTMLQALARAHQGIGALVEVELRDDKQLVVTACSATTDERWLLGQLADELASVAAQMTGRSAARTEEKILAHAGVVDHTPEPPPDAAAGIVGPARVTELRMVHRDDGQVLRDENGTPVAEIVCVLRVGVEDARRAPACGTAWLTMGGSAVEVSTDPADAPEDCREPVGS